MVEISFSQLPSQQLRKDISFGRFNWKIAEDKYKEGKYVEALCSVISYIDENTGQQFRIDPKTGVKISHGSVQMYITINNDQLQVLAPFVDISKAQKMVVLRRICEINFNVLALAKIECKEDTLMFKYSCPIQACEPWKIYDILREICWTADKYDDDFVIMQGASWVYEPDITPFSDARKEQSWKGFKLYLQEARDWIAFWQQAGYSYIVWDIIYITLLKIDHYCAPQGIIKNTLVKDIGDIVSNGINQLNMLDHLPQSAFFTQLYDVSTFIPTKITGSAANVQTALKSYLTDGYSYITKNDFANGYLCLQKGIYRLLYYYRFNEAQWKQLELILAGNNNLPLADATNKLYDQLNEFYNNPRDQFLAPAPDKKEEKKGLFENWFS